MSTTVSISEDQIFGALQGVLQSFGLTSAQPGGTVEIVKGQVNRVPEPRGQDFVVMWPLRSDRLATNIDTLIDTTITGSIAGNVLTVSAVQVGSIAIGAILYSPLIVPAASIVSQISGASGGIGTYAVTPTGNAASGPIYCGTKAATQKTEMTVQTDVHGPNGYVNAIRISTLWRDQTGVDACAAQGGIIVPLYTQDPRQIPFVNGEDQYEERWIVEMCLQVDPTVTTTQQFATAIDVTAVEVETLA